MRPSLASQSTRTVIDLFSGAGGLSLGASRAGFSVIGAVELDDAALDTHRRNFPHTAHLAADVATLRASAPPVPGSPSSELSSSTPPLSILTVATSRIQLTSPLTSLRCEVTPWLPH